VELEIEVVEELSNFGNGYFGTTAVSSAGTNASGIGIFEYDVPTGLYCFINKRIKFIMAYTTIKKPSDYFNTKLYTGTVVHKQSITGVRFQPDFGHG
jgi:hypothetical protein